MKEALFYKSIDSTTVQCFLCPHYCVIREGSRGKCGVRENIGGALQSLVYGKVLTTAVDPIEKKPLYHFLPGSHAFSVATVGCNMSCGFCQNWDISQSPKPKAVIMGHDMTPEQVADAAIGRHCESIAYTYTEPTVFMEFALDIIHASRQRGLKNVFVSNGFMTPQAIDAIIPHLDAINIDIKAFTDQFYRDICDARLKPVLDAIRQIHASGVWLEITSLIIPGYNDSDEMITHMAEFIASLDSAVPWHISRFHPDFKMLDVSSTPVETIHRAVKIGKETGLKYVYAGNVPGDDYESTYCPQCGKRIIGRSGYSVGGIRLDGNQCAYCGEPIDLFIEIHA